MGHLAGNDPLSLLSARFLRRHKKGNGFTPVVVDVGMAGCLPACSQRMQVEDTETVLRASLRAAQGASELIAGKVNHSQVPQPGWESSWDCRRHRTSQAVMMENPAQRGKRPFTTTQTKLSCLKHNAVTTHHCCTPPPPKAMEHATSLTWYPRTSARDGWSPPPGPTSWLAECR